MLNKRKFHPYKLTSVQELKEEDFGRRVEFCHWLLETHIADDTFITKLFTSDECVFYNDGNMNHHNCHYWARENPHWMQEGHTQRRWSVNVWAGIIGDYVIGPYFINGNVTANSYIHFLNNEFNEMLQILPPEIRETMWFQQDGHPAHTANATIQVLNQKFPNRWIGKHGPIAWPPRSPDLSPLYFFLWGYIKDKIYNTRPGNLNELKNRISNAIREITPEILRKVRENMIFRAVVCFDNDGRQFEHITNR